MHPATAMMFAKAVMADRDRDAELRRLRAQSRRQASTPSKARSWPQRILRLGNASSGA
jgi:hypothetical protein